MAEHNDDSPSPAVARPVSAGLHGAMDAPGKPGETDPDSPQPIEPEISGHTKMIEQEKPHEIEPDDRTGLT